MAEAAVAAGGLAADGSRPGGPRSRKGVRTRARLVAAAKEVFEEHGFLDARISDIAERAGLSHGSFYHYFDSKEEVFLEVAAGLEERMQTSAIAGSTSLADDPDLDTLDVLRRSCRSYLERYRDEARIMGVIEQVARYDDDFRQARSQREQRYLSEAGLGLAQLQAAGRADPTLDPRLVGPALMGMITRFAELWLVEGAVECTLDEAVENLASLLRNSLGVVAPTDLEAT